MTGMISVLTELKAELADPPEPSLLADSNNMDMDEDSDKIINLYSSPAGRLLESCLHNAIIAKSVS